MSIILDALKKAEGKKEASGSSTPENSASAASGGDSVRDKLAGLWRQSPFGGKLDLQQNKRAVILLGVVLVVGLGLLLFGNPLTMLSGGGETQPVVTNQAPADKLADQMVKKQMVASQEEAKRLRKSAIQNFRDGNLQETLQNYARLTILASTDAEIYNNYGVALRRSGQIEDARQAYEQALALKPNYPEALNNLAIIYMMDNKYNKAKEMLSRAIALNPNYVDPYFHMAIAMEKNGQTDEAIKNYEKFLEMSVDQVGRTVRLQVEEKLSKLKE